MKTIRIATRKSQLALWQAEYVSAALRQAHPGLEVELVTMTSKGDRILDAPLAKVGGKGLFIKELEDAILRGDADIAVHSMKDVPVICEREDPRDAYVSNTYKTFDELPQGAVLGTSSLRRQCQVLARRPDLEVKFLRGNVNTRLAKLDAGEYDAIILASAGLKRLEFHERIAEEMDPAVSLPAVGQGAVGIECRADDAEVNALIATLNHEPTAVRVRAERAMNAKLEGGCQVPIAGYAELHEGTLFMRALVGRPDGSEVVRGDISGKPEDAEELGRVLGEDLLARGAGEILKEVYGRD